MLIIVCLAHASSHQIIQVPERAWQQIWLAKQLYCRCCLLYSLMHTRALSTQCARHCCPGWCFQQQWQQSRAPSCTSRRVSHRHHVTSVLPASTVASHVSEEQQAVQFIPATTGPPADANQIAIKRKAKAARLAENPKYALQLLLQGIQQYPHDMHLVAAAASAAAKLGDAELAFEVLSPALQEQPHNVHLLTAAAAAYRAKGDTAAARQCYQSSAAAQPSNAVVLAAWGALEASCGDVTAAANLFKQASAADPQHAPVYVAWAGLEASRGRVREARLLHQQAHKQDPYHVPNLHAWAELECGEGQWLLAIKLLEQALTFDSQHLPSWMSLGKARWALGDSVAARRVFQQACYTLGPRPELLNQWATLEQQSQRIAAARAVLAFLDEALQQQQQQQQQLVPGQQNAAQQPKQAGCTEQQQQEGSWPQQSRRTRKQQSKNAEENTSRSATQPAMQQQQYSTGSLSSASAAGTALSSVTGNHRTSSSNSMVDTPPLSQPLQQHLSGHLQQQLDHLVELLNNAGTPTRMATASAQGHVQQQQQQGSLVQPQQVSFKALQQQIPGVPCLPIPPAGLQQHIPSLASAAAMEHRAGNLGRALKLYSTALQQDPRNQKLLHAMAQLQLKRGDRAAAEVHLQALEAVEPGNGFLCYTRGVLCQQEGELNQAKQWFEQGMTAPGSEASLLNCEALAQLHAFRRDASAARATLAAGLSSRRPTARFLRAAALLERRLGDVDAAVQLMARAVARAPRDYRSWLAWAVLERRRHDYAAAARCFQRGTRCAPCNPHIWYAWAHMTWHDVGDFRAARRLYEQATTYCPRNAPLWMEWAMLEWDEARNISRARQLFQAGAGVPPSYQHPPLYQAWAQREADLGNHEQAQQLRSRGELVAEGCRKAMNQAV